MLDKKATMDTFQRHLRMRIFSYIIEIWYNSFIEGLGPYNVVKTGTNITEIAFENNFVNKPCELPRSSPDSMMWPSSFMCAIRWPIVSEFISTLTGVICMPDIVTTSCWLTATSANVWTACVASCCGASWLTYR